MNDYDKGTPVHDVGDVLFDNSHVCPYLLFSGKQGERVSSGHKTTALSEVSRLPGSHVNGISPKHVSSTSEEGAGVVWLSMRVFLLLAVHNAVQI